MMLLYKHLPKATSLSTTYYASAVFQITMPLETKVITAKLKEIQPLLNGCIRLKLRAVTITYHEPALKVRKTHAQVAKSKELSFLSLGYACTSANACVTIGILIKASSPRVSS